MDDGDVSRAWVGRVGEFSPDYYAHHGPDEASEAVRTRLDETVGREASVLELGCSAGRHLAHLYSGGYRDLWGVDVNPGAGPVLRQAYPRLAAEGSFAFEPLQDVLPRHGDGRFDAVFTVQTLQHLDSDDEAALAEIARVVGERLVTVEIEAGPPVTFVDDAVPLYRRNWGEAFADHGLEAIEKASVGRSTLRTFRPAGR